LGFPISLPPRPLCGRFQFPDHLHLVSTRLGVSCVGFRPESSSVNPPLILGPHPPFVLLYLIEIASVVIVCFKFNFFFSSLSLVFPSAMSKHIRLLSGRRVPLVLLQPFAQSLQGATFVLAWFSLRPANSSLLLFLRSHSRVVLYSNRTALSIPGPISFGPSFPH